jgi:hypothetical protein
MHMRGSHVRNWIISYSALLSLFSCATILNKRVQKISISTAKNVKVIAVGKAVSADSAGSDSDSARSYYVQRSRDPLKVDVQIDSSNKSFYLKPKNSILFWLNFSTYGVGMLVDMTNPKRFAYRKSYHFTADDTLNIRYRFIPRRPKRTIAPFEKGAINFSLSQPAANIFNMQTIDGPYASGGIFGIEAGADFFYRRNHFLSVSMGAATDVLPVDYIGPGYIDRGSAIFGSVRENIVLRNFSLGYGLSVSKFFWEEYLNDTISISHSISNIALGLSFAAQYRVTKYLGFEFLYQPGLLNTSFKPAFAYQHYMSFGVIWKFPIRKAAGKF